ncbi:NAD-dependent epimerase/dehydratase family protein [Alteromonas ponticola]|uniref:NAD(P)H-binding protein n=1 Tax=Alteromonas ponticola TaxID=2720613 RepID=A0ABX1R4S6_9ALTE|nr:NAD(P)H-binding protein [Alteromonas ponticola]
MAQFKTALVLGATGLVGKALIRQLQNDPRYKQVTCLVRRPMPLSLVAHEQKKVNWLVINFDALQEYEGYFKVDHVYCCLGTTIQKAGSQEAFRKVDFEYVHVAAQLARAQRCKSFVWISSIGANAKSSNFYLRVKGELENAIMGMSQLKNASAVRPSLLLGERHENRPLEDIAQTIAPVLGMLLMGPLKKYRPVSAIEVAHKMIKLQVFDDD